MLKDLTPGVKISISRSISTAFEQYMDKINWDENKADLHEFVAEWKEYIHNHASWYEKVDPELKADPSFHEELAAKINQIIEKILNEMPTPEQIEEIERLQKLTGGKEYTYSCRSEARYIIEKLNEELKKKQHA
jgi:glycyl-tRNA synthetase beta subunit